MSENIASIYIDVNLNTSKLQKDLLALEKQKFSINVNDSSLTNLNKHLDLKVSHFKQVQKFFDSNALKIRVDDSSLTQLNKTFDYFTKNKIAIEFDNQQIERDLQNIKKNLQGVKLQMTLDRSDLTKQIQESVNQIKPINIFNSTTVNKSNDTSADSIAQKIGKSVSRAINGNVIGNALNGVLNKTLGSMFTGAFENFGKELTKDFTKGLSESLNQGLNASIGSSTLVGEKLGSSIVEAISKNIPEELKKELQEDINNVLGELDITIAKNASRRIVTKKQEKRGSLAEEQIVLDRREAFRNYREKASNLKDIGEKLTQNSESQIKGFDLSSRLTKLAKSGNGTPELQQTIKEVSENLEALQLAEQKLLEEQEVLNKQVIESRKKLQSIKKDFQLTAPDALPQAYAQALKDVAGTKFNLKNAPKLIVDDATLKAQGAKAAYSVDSNSLLVNSEMKKAIEAGRMTAEQMITFYHEIQHALDFDFGSTKGVQANRSNVILTKPIAPTKEELKAVSPLIAKYSPEERLVELNAEVSGRRKGLKAFNLQGKLNSSDDFIKSYGKDGEKLNSLVNKQLEEVKASLLKVAEFAKNKGVDVQEDLQNYIETIKTFKSNFAKVGDEISAVQNQQLNVDDISKVQENIVNMFADIDNIEKQMKIFQLETLKKAKSAIKNPVNAKESQKIAVELQQKANQGKASTLVNQVSNQSLLPKIPNVGASQFEAGMEDVKKRILPAYKNLFSEMQKDFENNRLDFVSEDDLGALAKAKTLLDALKIAKQDIERIRTDLGIPKIGGLDAPKINQSLSQLKAIENKTKRQLEIAKNRLEKNSNSSGDEEENLRKRLNPLKANSNATSEEKQKIAELNKLLEQISDNIDAFEFKFQKVGKTITNEFQKSVKSVQEFSNNFLTGSKNIGSFEDAIGGALSTVGKLFAGFIGVNILSNLIGKLNEFKTASLETAKELQTLNRQVVFSAGGGSEGRAFLADIRQTAEDFRLNIKTTLQSASGFKTATEGTSIEGKLGDETFKNFSKLLAARGTNQAKSSNFLLALEQSASKGIQSEELRGQMAEAVPGIISIFARSQGQSNKQFLNKMRSTTGGLDQSVLFEASQQAAAESQLSLNSSFDTLDSKLSNFDNKLLKLQEKVGNILLPLEGLKFDFAASGIEFLVSNVENISKTVTVVVLTLTRGLWWNGLKIAKDLIVASAIGLKGYVADLILMGRIQTAGMTGLQASAFLATGVFNSLKLSVIGIAKAFAPFLIMHVAIEALTAGFRVMQALFTDLSGEVGKFADGAAKANEELENLFKTGRKEKKIEFATDVQTQSEKYYSKKNIFEKLNPFDTGVFEGNKKSADTLKATEKLLNASSELRDKADSGVVAGNIQELAEIDRKLNDARVKADAIARLTPNDTEQLKQLRDFQSKLGEDRSTKILNVGAVQKEIEGRIKELKATKDELTKQAEDGFIFEENYKESIDGIDEELKKLELQQDKITKAIGKSKNAFDLLKLSIQDAFTGLEDAKQKIETLAALQKNQLVKSSLNGGLTQGNSVFLSSILDIQTQLKTLNANKQFVNSQQNNFQNPEASRILKAYNVNNSTGVNRINQIAEKVENENQKFILQEFAKLQQAKNELVNSRLQISQAQEQFRQQLIEQTKQVNEYYRNISRNFQETTLEISKLSLQTRNTQISTKLRESLANGYETIISTLVSGIEEALNSFTSAADKALDSQKDLLTTQFNIQDATRGGQELARSIPSVKVDLDFSSIPNDSNITQLRDEIDSTIGGTEELGKSINLSINSSEDLGKSFESLINPLIENDKQTQEIFKNLKDSQDTTGKISDSTNQWNDTLKNVTPQVETINSGFNGLLDSLTNIFLKTNEWLAGLLKAPEIIGGIVNNISQTPIVQGIQQLGNGILNSNNPDVTYGKIIEPVDRKRFPITSGFGNRIIFGKSDFHEGLDYGTPVGTPIKAPVSGRVTHAGALGTAGITVKIAGVDSQGRKTEDMLLHLSEALVKVGDVIQQGQVVARSGNTGRGTGAHLDWRRKVNGQYENPEVSLRTSAHLPVKTQPIVQISKLSLQNSPANFGSNTSASGISRGGNLLNQAEVARLTPLGKQLYALQQNPKVLAFADVVARAEGTDFRSNSKNFGYSMMIGGSHDTDFSRHPFAGNQGSRIRAPRHNSTASGRYQMMDFNYSLNQAGKSFGRGAKSDMSALFQGENPGSFSPAVQDLYFLGSLKSRGILDKVLRGDFEGALNTKGIAQHYASLQSGGRKSAYGGQGTPEGQLRNTIPFAQQRLQARLGGNEKPLIQSPGSLQSKIGSGTQLSIDSISQKSQANQANLEAQRKRDILNGETALNKVKRQTERVVRESQDKLQSNARALTDAKFESIPFPTTEQQNKKASTDILRKKQDTLKQFQRDLEDAKKAVSEADSFIKKSQETLVEQSDPNVKNALTVGIQQSKKLREVKLKEIADINSKISETSKAFDAQEASRFDKANFEEYLRSSKSAIELQTQENAGLQERITSLEKIKEISPTDPRVELLPELKRQLAFQQLEVETATKLLDIEEKIKKSGNDPKITAELQKQLIALESQNDAKVRTIELTNQQLIKEEERAKILRDFEIRSKVADITNQFADNGIKYTQRENSKNAFGVDIGNLTKARISFAQAQTTLADLDLEKNIRDIQEFGRREGLAANQVNAFVENFKMLNDIKLTNIKNELDDLINSDSLAELQKVRENLQTQFNLKEQPRLDLINAKADRFERIGGNQFVANKMRRDAAREAEMFARDQALRNVDEQVSQARTRGIAVTDSEVESLKNNLIEISELKLDGLNNQFKNISTALGDIVKQGLTSFSQGIADLITKGGSLEDVFDNLFNNILNSVINMGLNSLMGGLLGGGGLFSGLFYAGKLPNYASGNVPIHPQSLNNALRKERMMSGRNAQIGIVHENELIIPAGRTEELAKAGLSPEMLLGRNFANGQMPSGVRRGLIDRKDNSEISVKTQVINKVEYVDMEQFQQGLNAAAKRGAEQGAKKVQMSLQNSSSYRSSVGL